MEDVSKWVHSLASTLQDGMWHNRGRLTFTGDFNGDGTPDTGALTLLSKETASRAGRLLDEALELFPDYPSALFNRGLVHFVLKEEVQAVSFFERR